MRRYIATTSLVLLAAGCNAFDERAEPTTSEEGTRLLIPTDERPVQKALRAPPPISGGTLAVDQEGHFAVAADPDRDRVSVVDLTSSSVKHLQLAEGEEPGRVVIDTPLGVAYVALRRSGDLLRVDLAHAEELGRTHVCSAPRGLLRDVARAQTHVACADGRLVSVDAQGVVARTIDLGTDLRDVMLDGSGLVVTTYKGAELIRIDGEGTVSSRAELPRIQVSVDRQVEDPTTHQINFTSEMQSMRPHLAYRALQQSDGSVMMLHQDSSEGMVEIDKEPTANAASTYGGSNCQGIVMSDVTQIGPRGATRAMQLAGAVLAVDMALSPTESRLAVALPGTAEEDTPRPSIVFDNGDGSGGVVGPGATSGFGGGSVAVYDTSSFSGSADGIGAQPLGCNFPIAMAVGGQATAVAYMPDGRLVAQTREPAGLTIIAAGDSGAQSAIDLGGDSVRDTGHDLFHRDSGSGIACASCHGEAGDDGHTWLFSRIGMRRTQAVHVGLEGTAPFHWDGDMSDLGVLMEEVFVGRMGGVHQSGERLDALQSWLFAQRPPAPIMAADDPAVMRGKALFESDDVGCTGCHTGAQLTNNQSYDVGTSEEGEALQVPSLRGVGYRAPFIHNGCAESLRDRFDPACGGDKHGNTGNLGDGEIDDMVAYLRSL